MTEEKGVCHMRKSKTGKAVRMVDGEVVYVASIRSIEQFLRGEREFVAFAKYPYRKIPRQESERDCVYTYCPKCEAGRVFRKIREDAWKCEACGTELTTAQLIGEIRSIAEGY